MSIDSLGRVVVGSGHFADQAPRVMENISRFSGEERNFTRIENGARNVWASVKRVDKVLGEKLYDMRFPENSGMHVEKNPGRFVGTLKRIDQSLGEKVYDLRFPSNPDQLATIMSKASRQEAAERMSQQAGENLEQLGEAGKDLLEAFAWGAAGDLESASSKAVDGAVKMAEVWWKGILGPSGE